MGLYLSASILHSRIAVGLAESAEWRAFASAGFQPASARTPSASATARIFESHHTSACHISLGAREWTAAIMRDLVRELRSLRYKCSFSTRILRQVSWTKAQ